MQSGRFGFRRVLHGPATSQWVVHTAERFPGAPPHAERRQTWRVAALHLQQVDPTTATGLLLLFADLPEEAVVQLRRDLSYLLVGADDALYLDCLRAVDLGTVELLGEVRRLGLDEAELAADEDDRRAEAPPAARRDMPLH